MSDSVEENRSPHLLEMDSVSVRYQADSLALKRVSFSLDPGESLAVLGPSGSGKTTLLKVLAGLLVPVEGAIRYGGKSYGTSRGRRSADDPRRRLGMTFQNSGLFDSLTCSENLVLALRECGVAKAEWAERVHAALADVGLSRTEDLYPHEISGGMKKRLGIARALLLRPDVVLYDDPTAGLDPVTSRSIVELLKNSREKRETAMTMVLVTSDLPQAFRLCEKVAFLNRGELVEIGPVSQLRNSQRPDVHQFMHGLLKGPLTDEIPDGVVPV